MTATIINLAYFRAVKARTMEAEAIVTDADSRPSLIALALRFLGQHKPMPDVSFPADVEPPGAA